MYDLAYEKLCLDGWRNEIDTDSKGMMDQLAFARVLRDYNQYRCKNFQMSQQFMTFATKSLMRRAMNERHGLVYDAKKNFTYPTFIHITKTRVKMVNNATLHDELVRHLLDLKDNETEMMTGTISWNDTVSHKPHRGGTK